MKKKLPNQQQVIEWKNESVVRRLMKENRWTRLQASQWFTDFMCWLYTSIKWQDSGNGEFVMDGMHYLDDVWHAYVLNTRDYFKMSQELFGIDYIHHDPNDSFATSSVDSAVFEKQLHALLEDWGEDYMARVYGHASDVSLITQKPISVEAV